MLTGPATDSRRDTPVPVDWAASRHNRFSELLRIEGIQTYLQELFGSSNRPGAALALAREFASRGESGLRILEAGLLFGGLLHKPCFTALSECAESGDRLARAILRSALDKRAIYAGSFDPFTLGHRDIAARAAQIFDDVIISVGFNPAKKTSFLSVEDRIALIKADLKDVPGNFQVMSFTSLVASKAQQTGTRALIRGIRGVTDHDVENQQAFANRLQSEGFDLDTCILMARQEFQNHSSTNVRTLASYRGGNIAPYVTPNTERVVKDKAHTNALAQHWQTLFSNSDPKVSQDVFQEVTSRYRDANRHYHNLEHIFDMLMLLDELVHDDSTLKALPLDEIRAAVFFHDAVYDSSRQDNEAQSAELARTCLQRSGWEEAKIDRVCRLIAATAKHQLAQDLSGCELFLDLDLSILGDTPERYLRYADNIRREYSQYSDADFSAGRATVLEIFLARKPLFYTVIGQELFLTRARENLKAEIRILNQQPPTHL